MALTFQTRFMPIIFVVSSLPTIFCTHDACAEVYQEYGENFEYLTRKSSNKLYKFDDNKVAGGVVKFPCKPDSDVLPDGYVKVPGNLSSPPQHLIGQQMGGFSGRCTTEERRVCHLTKCVHYKGKNYCLKKCSNEKVSICI